MEGGLMDPNQLRQIDAAQQFNEDLDRWVAQHGAPLNDAQRQMVWEITMSSETPNAQVAEQAFHAVATAVYGPPDTKSESSEPDLEPDQVDPDELDWDDDEPEAEPVKEFHEMTDDERLSWQVNRHREIAGDPDEDRVYDPDAGPGTRDFIDLQVARLEGAEFEEAA